MVSDSEECYWRIKLRRIRGIISACAAISRQFDTIASAVMSAEAKRIQEGDQLPEATFYYLDANQQKVKTTTKEYFGSKKVACAVCVVCVCW